MVTNSAILRNDVVISRVLDHFSYPKVSFDATHFQWTKTLSKTQKKRFFNQLRTCEVILTNGLAVHLKTRLLFELHNAIHKIRWQATEPFYFRDTKRQKVQKGNFQCDFFLHFSAFYVTKDRISSISTLRFEDQPSFRVIYVTELWEDLTDLGIKSR
jgi:hypothetical protein